MDSNRGFTLIEVLISVMIMAAITVLTAMSIQRSLKLKTKLEKQIAEESALRDAVALMSHDINEAFHWWDVYELMRFAVGAATPTPAAAPGQPNQPGQPGVPPQPPPPAAGQPPGAAANAQAATNIYQQALADKLPVASFPADKRIPVGEPTPIPVEQMTAFVGQTDSLYLTTLTHVRIHANSPESEQAQVGYYLKDPRDKKEGGEGKVLIRSETPVLSGDVTTPGKETALLDHVTKLKFRYYSSIDTEWHDSWNSMDHSNSTLQHNFPDAVEITLEAMRDKHTVKIQTMAEVHAPNNDPFGFRGENTPPPGAQLPGAAAAPGAPNSRANQNLPTNPAGASSGAASGGTH